MNDVVVTGVGLVSSLGTNAADALDAMRHLRTGLVPWHPLPDTNLPVTIAGPIPGFDVSGLDSPSWSWPDHLPIDRSVLRGMPPHGLYAMAALTEAMAQANLAPDACRDGRTGLYAASGGSPRLTFRRLAAMENNAWQRGHPLGVISSVAGTLNFHFAAILGIRGESCGFVSACASSAHAIGYAADAIRLGRQDRIIVIGAEDICLESVMPFHGMGALTTGSDPALAMRPFDRDRSGFAATGGAAVLILESSPSARRRHATPLARLAGWGQAADGYHPAAPHPQGIGLADAINLALADAQSSPADVDYINAHGTGTPAGDAAEALALSRIFNSSCPPISSTKALTGHGLSLAGAMEAVLAILALRHAIIPGQAHLTNPLPEGAHLNFPRLTTSHPIRSALNNSSGFGGANVVHLFTHA